MPQKNMPRVEYDNVVFDLDGTRVVATVIGYDEEGKMILANPTAQKHVSKRPRKNTALS